VATVDERTGRGPVIDLLGVLAYAELTAFDRLAEDARLAPTLEGRAALARMAAAEIGHHERLADRLRELGADATAAMTPFVAALDAFHDGTRASTWLEGLVKAYVGDGLATDFYREVAAFLPQPDRALVEEVLVDTGHADFALREVRAAVAADPTLSGRLALWARRLVGEALTQSQAVIAEHDDLADLIITGTGDLAGVGELLARLTTAHSQRMRALGLNP
jgi:tRNA-(MS[2]IO[6]A)-hydroxylase (MiaE)-like